VRCERHHRPHLGDEVGRHPSVQHVRHAVDEDVADFAPPKRLEQRLRVDGDTEPRSGGARVAVVLVFRLAHRLRQRRRADERFGGTHRGKA
jgi:hypothetical protein